MSYNQVKLLNQIFWSCLWILTLVYFLLLLV